jgi:hypothetical protein
MKKLMALVWAALACAVPASAHAQDGVATVDRYMRAAIELTQSHGARGLDTLRSLDAGGLPAAGALVALIGASPEALRPGGALADNPAVRQLRDIWAGAERVPPPAAGNTGDFMALQILPQSLDAAIAAWVDANFVESAAYWLLRGTTRLGLEAMSCPSEPGRAELRLYWLPYAGSALQASGRKEAFLIAYGTALARLLANWDTDFPLPADEWLVCQAGKQAGESAPARRQRLAEARTALRAALMQSVAALTRPAGP